MPDALVPHSAPAEGVAVHVYERAVGVPGRRGPVVLEYLPAFRRWLVPDALALRRIAAQAQEE